MRPPIPRSAGAARIACSGRRGHSIRPFDIDAARAYGRVFSAVMASGRKAAGARAVDLLIAATALGAGLPLYTRNGDDFQALDDLVEVVVL